MKYIHIISASDSSGGAGMQQDVRTVSAACGCWPVCTVSGITCQSFSEVLSVSPVSLDVFRQQLRSSLNFPISAVKIGALFTIQQIREVIRYLENCNVPAVIDPVFASTGGFEFYTGDMVSLLKDELIPLASTVTPNRSELEKIFKRNFNDIHEAAEFVFRNRTSTAAYCIKGGHFPGHEMVEAIVDSRISYISKRRRIFPYSHGTGCMLSSFLACNLALGADLSEAFSAATLKVAEFYEKLDI